MKWANLVNLSTTTLNFGQAFYKIHKDRFPYMIWNG